MVRKFILREPICEGFWDPWQASEQILKPPEKLRPKRICQICLSEIEEGVSYVECPHCGNLMHRSCLENWVKVKGNVCPVCGRPLP
ncbi:MAG: hypothetical protein B6U65_01665 [Candidatus Wolframiiraptor sp. EX4484-121]|nr:MAG: hypothetical protein B6U65_01665 [Candidatus Wolframiiraptor sp. EX4484-121]